LETAALIDVIQWVPGAGQPPTHEWVDVLKRCQAAGKGLHLHGKGLDFDRVKALSRELRPEGLLYCLDVPTQREVEEVMGWLERNT
jgi:hypothetical protein